MISHRALATWIGLAVGAAVARAAAAGEPLPEEARRRAEDAFVIGRLEDLGAALGTGTEPVDLEPLLVTDLFWRLPPLGREGARATEHEGLSSRRIAWARQYRERRAAGVPAPGEYPMPEGAALDPYPRLTALVLDRLRRESLGVTGLPYGGPLKALDSDPAIAWFLERLARPAYLGLKPGDFTPEERAQEQRLVDERQSLADRNRLLGLSGVAALLALAAALSALARPPRSTLPAP